MSEKYWRVHVDQILNGEAKSVLNIALDIYKSKKPKLRRGFGFTPSAELDNSEVITKKLIIELTNFVNGKIKKEQVMEDFNEITAIDETIRILKEYTKDMADYHISLSNKKIQAIGAPETAREKDLFNLGLILIESANWGDAGVAQKYIDSGFPINFQHPITKKTALHIAAMYTLTDLTKTLMDSGKCDLLLRDKKGHLVADIAYTQGHDLEAYELIEEKTKQQAVERGVDVEFEHALHF